jgi:aldose 1-epimerase
VAIEPMTCPPNALRTGASLIELREGERWHASWGIATALD